MNTAGTVIGGGGWAFVEKRMERQIEQGMTTPEAFGSFFAGGDQKIWFSICRCGHLFGSHSRGSCNRPTCGCEIYKFAELRPDETYYQPPLMDSWLHFQTWRGDHPGSAPPASINTIRTDEQFQEWANEGFPGGVAAHNGPDPAAMGL